MSILLKLLLIFMIIIIVSIKTNAATFKGVGFLGNETNSHATDISGDGKTVIGGSGFRSFSWSEDKSMIILDLYHENWFNGNGFPKHDCSYAEGVSYDGKRIIGTSTSCTSYGGRTAVLWDNGGVSLLGGPDRHSGVDISNDGNTVIILDVGPQNTDTYIINLSTNNYLHLFPRVCFIDSVDPDDCFSVHEFYPHAISGNGNIVVGNIFDA
jgi:uncharacterized membrane protein